MKVLPVFNIRSVRMVIWSYINRCLDEMKLKIWKSCGWWNVMRSSNDLLMKKMKKRQDHVKFFLHLDEGLDLVAFCQDQSYSIRSEKRRGLGSEESVPFYNYLRRYATFTRFIASETKYISVLMGYLLQPIWTIIIAFHHVKIDYIFGMNNVEKMIIRKDRNTIHLRCRPGNENFSQYRKSKNVDRRIVGSQVEKLSRSISPQNSLLDY